MSRDHVKLKQSYVRELDEIFNTLSHYSDEDLQNFFKSYQDRLSQLQEKIKDSQFELEEEPQCDNAEVIGNKK